MLLNTKRLLAGMSFGLAAGSAWAQADAPAVVDAPASEKAEPGPKTGISAVLGELDWGQSNRAVLESIKTGIDEKYAKILKTADGMLVDKILHRKSAEFAAVKQTFTQFTGSSGLKSSIIGSDFESNANESMLRVDDGATQRYYFFRDDKLWKILVAYSAATQVPFKDFVAQVKAKHGRPLETELSGKATTRVHWADAQTHLMLEDRSEFLGSIIMKYLAKGEGVALEKARQAKAVAAPAVNPRVDSVMADIMGDDSGDDVDIVDRITGVEHVVDLETGRPEAAHVNREPRPARKTKARKGPRRGKKKARSKAPAEPDIIY